MMSIGWWAFVVLTIAVGVRASGTITGERERQTWEGLLTTPLSEQEIVRGKLRGILRSAWWYLITFGLAAILTAMFLAPVAALGVVLVIGPAMVVIAAAMYFVGAAGLYCSARSQSSWRSLLATLAMGYAGAFLLFCCSGVVFYVGALILAAILSQSGSLGWLIITPVGWLAAVALAYWWAGAMLLATAEMRIALSDRIPNGRGRLIDLDLPYHPTRRVRRPPL
jgi:ABC-type Na+ efflux pump permease subunit